MSRHKRSLSLSVLQNFSNFSSSYDATFLMNALCRNIEWHRQTTENGCVVVSKVVSTPTDGASFNGAYVAISAVICSTGIKNLYVRRHELDIENNVAIRKLICDPKSVTVDCHADFLKALDSTYICQGNPDLEFAQLCMSRKSQFKSKSGEVTAHLDSYSPFVFQDRQYSQTVRATSCLLLVKSATRRCSKCASFRSALRVLLRRSVSAGPVNKYTPNAIMRTPVLKKNWLNWRAKGSQICRACAD